MYNRLSQLSNDSLKRWNVGKKEVCIYLQVSRKVFISQVRPRCLSAAEKHWAHDVEKEIPFLSTVASPSFSKSAVKVMQPPKKKKCGRLSLCPLIYRQLALSPAVPADASRVWKLRMKSHSSRQSDSGRRSLFHPRHKPRERESEVIWVFFNAQVSSNLPASFYLYWLKTKLPF